MNTLIEINKKNQQSTLNRTWLNSALLYLFIVACLGAFLRFLNVETVDGVNFKYFLHAHSHTALLGWVYAALYVALIHAFLPFEKASAKKYKWLFWATQLSVLGMLLSFPVGGYFWVSIIFSTLHILCSYVFVFYFLKDLKCLDLVKYNPVSVSFVKVALLFLVISSFGPFSLGPIMAKGFSGSNIYYLAIYYYLHFQYNGWMTFAVFALLFKWWEMSGCQFSQTKAKLFFHLLFWSCFPAYILSALWTKPYYWLYIIGGAAATIQLIAFIHFAASFFHIWKRQKMLLPKVARILFVLSFTALAIKFTMQLFSALPEIADLTYKIREFVIGYLHLVLIGFVSLFLFAYFISHKAWNINNFIAKSGITIFIIAFILSELLIFLQGFLYWQVSFNLPNYTVVLFAVSLFLPVGIVMFLLGQFQNQALQDLQD